VYNRFWRVKPLPLAQLCARRLLHNKLPTFDKLYRKEVQLNNTMCIMCEISHETIKHLFFTLRLQVKYV